jgi:hypothetical protein
MASKARASFDKNAKDIERLLELHESDGGKAPGRRYGLEVLNKSAIVLLVAFWEAYCEDIAAEALEHIVKNANDADALPLPLKKLVAKALKADQNELAIWKISDEGWRKYLADRFGEMKKERDKKLNTPKTVQIDELFASAVGIENISKSWRWKKSMTPEKAIQKLDELVTLRGAIAHRGANTTSVKKSHVIDYFEFIKLLTSRTGGAVNAHCRKVTKKTLWSNDSLRKHIAKKQDGSRSRLGTVVDALLPTTDGQLLPKTTY